MDVVTRSLRWQRGLVGAVPAAAALVFLRAAYDVFNTTKATVVVVGTVAVLLVGALRVSRTRRIELPRGPAVAAAAAFALALVMATLTSPLPLASLVGRPGRHTGLALYLTYLVLFVLSARLYRDTAPTAFVRTLLGATVPVTAYGLLQAAGVEPFGWQAVEGGPQVFSTFGNANFFAAFLGMVVPLGVWGALTSTWSAPWRAAAGSLAGLAFLVTYLSHSQQGPAVAVVGSALVAGTALVSSPARSRTVKAGVLGGAALLFVLVLLGILLGVGPLATVRGSLASSLGTRIPKWLTALAVFRDHPVTGVGLDRFADWFYAYRPASLAAQTGLLRSTDTPHNVPIEMLVNGGVPLALTYLAFVVLTGWALVVGLRRNTGEDRLLLGGLGGAWIAYQLQSLVSIDVPPVAVLHYLLAGTIVGLGTRPGLLTVRLPGLPPPPTPKGKGRARAQQPPLAPANPLLTAALVLVGLAAVFVATIPLRADLAAGSATRQTAPAAAVSEYRRAAAIASWEGRYPALEGGFLAGQAGGARADEALAAHLQAAEREPRGLAHALNVARLSALAGRPEEADARWERVLEIDPTTPEVLAEAGAHWLERGDLERASRLVEQALATRESDASLWVAAGEVRAATRDVAAARAAFQRALEIDPQVQGGAEGLARLDGLA